MEQKEEKKITTVNTTAEATMKMRTRKPILLIAIIIAAVITVSCLAGCSGRGVSVKSLDEKFVEMMNLLVVKDYEGIYDYFYPGTVDYETTCETVDKMLELYPVADGYTWSRTGWNITRGLFDGSVAISGTYAVESAGKKCTVSAEWVSDKNGSGFRSFHFNF